MNKDKSGSNQPRQSPTQAPKQTPFRESHNGTRVMPRDPSPRPPAPPPERKK